MCDFCGFKGYDTYIKSGDYKVAVCCNHLLALVLFGDVLSNVPEGEFESEISGRPGAVEVSEERSDVRYFVTKDEAERLLGNALMPNEFQALIDAGHSMREFALLDKFYDEDGLAFRPERPEIYIENLKSYVKNESLPKPVAKAIKKHIASFKD